MNFTELYYIQAGAEQCSAKLAGLLILIGKRMLKKTFNLDLIREVLNKTSIVL